MFSLNRKTNISFVFFSFFSNQCVLANQSTMDQPRTNLSLFAIGKIFRDFRRIFDDLVINDFEDQTADDHKDKNP